MLLFVGCFSSVHTQEKSSPQPETVFIQPIQTFNQADKKTDLQSQTVNDLILSKADCVLITSVKHDSGMLNIVMKNNCRENIAAMRIRAMNSSSMLPYFKIEPEKERDFSTPIDGYMVEQGFIVEAVLFDNGSGDGEPEKVKSLQMVFAGSRNELEKILEIINSEFGKLSTNPSAGLKAMKKQIVLLPEDYVDFKKVGMGGILLFSGRANYWGRISEIEANKEAQNSAFVIKEINKIKVEIGKTIEGYPKVADQ